MRSRVLKRVSSVIAIAVTAAIGIPGASAQALHTIHASIVTPPAGSDSDFTVKLTMSPTDIDISGFDILVGYDNTQGTLINITDNTGQPHAAVEYIVEDQEPPPGDSYANTFVSVVMSTAADLMQPENLAQLNFHTSASYNNPDGEFWVYLDKYAPFGGPGGLADGNFNRIPTAYDSLEPTSAVSDWTLY